MVKELRSFRAKAAEYLKKLIEKGDIANQSAAGIKLGISQQAVQKILSSGLMGKPTIAKLLELYPEAREFIYNPSFELQPISDPDGGNFMEVPLITAYGGLPDRWDDPEIMDTLPKYTTLKRVDGNYLAFSCIGDSMDADCKNAICEGDIVLGRELQQHHWRNKLHIPRIFIIVHRVMGCMIKEVIAHDVEKGEIVAHSYNPEYPDITINLNDCIKLFYAKELKTNRLY